jgi:hypothetical protein
MNRDVEETSAVDFCGTVSKAAYSAQTVSRLVALEALKGPYP